MLERLKSLVEFAYDNVPLYRRLYQDKPEIKSIEDFSQIPRLDRSDFALCSIEDILSDPDEAIAILPPVENKTIFPFPRLENATDRDSRYEVFYWLLKSAGIMDETRFLIITDSQHSYYCGEIASNLLYFGHPTCMMVLRDHRDDELVNWISRFAPDYLLLGLRQIPDIVLNCGVQSIITINHYSNDMSYSKPPESNNQNDLHHFDIYAIPEVGWVGIRLPEGPYMYPSEYFYIETDPDDNIITVTVLESKLQPFIRYKTLDKGQVLKNGQIRITYIGEH